MAKEAGRSLGDRKAKGISRAKAKKTLPRICYINPVILLKRPISEISSEMASIGYRTSILIPKKPFRNVFNDLHHSDLMKGSKICTYSAVNPPFIKSEQPIPITPCFLGKSIRAMKDNDIIHMWVPYYLTNLKIIMMKKLFFRKKLLILTMDTVPGYSFSMGKHADMLFRMYHKLFGRLIFRTPDAITLYGKSLVPYALKAGVPKEKIRVIPTGIRPRDAISDNERDDARRIVRNELGISQKTRIILFVGILIDRKGVKKVLQVAHRLKSEDAVFLLVSDGPERKEYEKEAERLKLGGKARFLGWRKDMQRLYLASDALILPAEGEGLPGAVMEAMSFGLPCVASSIPCIPELITDGKDGYLCPKDDISCFARKILLLLHDKKKHDALSGKAIEKMKAFTWGKVLKEYEKLYHELIGKKQGGK